MPRLTPVGQRLAHRFKEVAQRCRAARQQAFVYGFIADLHRRKAAGGFQIQVTPDRAEMAVLWQQHPDHGQIQLRQRQDGRTPTGTVARRLHRAALL